MSSFKVFDIAGSGMSAQTSRMNLVASNLANVDAVSSSTEQTYRSRQPVFRAVLDQLNPDGTVAKVREEMANMMSASRSYQNNVEVINAARQMLAALINLGR